MSELNLKVKTDSSSKLGQQKKRKDLIIEIVIILLSLLIIIPLLIMILGSVKNPAEAQQYNLRLPSAWQFDNYSYVFTTGKIAKSFLNSVIVTVGSLLVCIPVAALAGFAISRRSGLGVGGGTKFFNNYFLVGLVAPMQMITTFALLKTMGLLGTYFGVIFVIGASQIPWAVFMIVNFVNNIPKELDQAALIDGASPIRMFVQIILPTLKPVFATTIVMVAMTSWNEFMIPLYFFNNSANWTLPLTVYNFFGQYVSNWNYVFADLVITALPITALYLYAQKYVVSGLTTGAVKG